MLLTEHCFFNNQYASSYLLNNFWVVFLPRSKKTGRNYNNIIYVEIIIYYILFEIKHIKVDSLWEMD